MSFTAETVLNAITYMNTDPRASEYLTEWSRSQNPEVQALELLSQDHPEKIQFVCATLLEKVIPLKYHLISPENRELMISVLRRELVESLSSAPVFEKIVLCFCHLAVFEFPEEFQEFESLIFCGLDNDSRLIAVSIQVLSSFLSDIDTTESITRARRVFLRNHFRNLRNSLVERVNWSFENDVQVKYGVGILRFLVAHGTDEENGELFSHIQKVCSVYAKKDGLLESVINCLKALLNQRAANTSYVRFVLLVIVSFASKDSLRSDGTPIMADALALRFLISVLGWYMKKLCSALNNQSDPYSTCVREAMEVMGIAPEVLRTALVNIIGTTISSRDMDIVGSYEYMMMWTRVLGPMVEEQNHPEGSRSVSKVMLPIWNEVLQNLYEILPEWVDDSRCPSWQSANLWSHIAKVDLRRMLAFLAQQVPSINLCYGLANLEFLANFDYMEVSILMKSILEYADGTSDPDLMIATLHALCRATTHELTDVFFNLAMKCMFEVEDESVVDAAVSALQKCTERISENILREYLRTLCERGEHYLTQMKPKTRWIMYQGLANWVIATCDVETATSYMQMLMEPVKNSLSEAESLNEEDLTTLLDIICEVLYRMRCQCEIVVDDLKPLILEVSSKIIGHCENMSIVRSCVSVMGATVVAKPVLDMDLFNSFVSIMFSRGKLEDYFLDFFAICRAFHPQLDDVFGTISEQFIQPVLGDPHFLVHILHMLTYFPMCITCPWFLDVCEQGIRSETRSDNIWAVNCITIHFKVANAEAWTPMVPRLIKAIFDALFDLMHFGSMSVYARCLSHLLFNCAESSTFETVAKPALHETVLMGIPGQAPEVAAHFVDNICHALVEAKSGFHHLYLYCVCRQSLLDIMVFLRKMSPCDDISLTDSDIPGWQGSIDDYNPPPPVEMDNPDILKVHVTALEAAMMSNLSRLSVA